MADQDAPTVADIENGSIDDDIRASFAEVSKGTETAPEPATEAAPVAPVKEPEEAEPAQEGRARDPETGRFLPKETPAEQPSAETPEGEQVEAAPQPAAEPEEEPLDPPVDWKLEQQEAFRTLPVAQQKFILDQVGGVAEKATQAEQATTRFKALDDLLAPRREQWARDGFDEVSVVRQVLSLSDYARNQPAQFVREFMQMKGLNPAELFPQAVQQPTGEEDPYAGDPVIQRLNAELSPLRQQLMEARQEIQRLTGTFQSRQQQEDQARTQRLDSEITAFQSAADEKGKQKHPYFHQVRSHMSVLVEKGLASTLEDAYDQACHANPEVRAKIASAAKAAEERDRVRQAKEKAEAARKAGSSVTGSPVTTRSEPQSTGEDVRDDLRAAFRETRGAASL